MSAPRTYKVIKPFWRGGRLVGSGERLVLAEGEALALLAEGYVRRIDVMHVNGADVPRQWTTPTVR